MLHLFIPNLTLRMFHAKITIHNLVLCTTHKVQVLKNCEHEHFSVYTCVHETHLHTATTVLAELPAKLFFTLHSYF
jgi:hypothetical protein